MAQELYELPEGWKWKDLSSIAEMSRRSVQPKGGSEYNYISLEHIEGVTGRLLGYSATQGGSISSSKTQFSKGMVLYGKLRPYLNKVYVAQFDGIATTEIIPFKCSDEIYPGYLAAYMRSGHFLEAVMSNCSGARMPRATTKFFKSIAKVPLPPLNEQKRIVAKIDALFTRIDTAITHLQQTLELSKALFASALDSALVPTGNIEIPPETWACKTLQVVSNLISDGTHHSPKEQFNQQQDGFYKYVTSKNIKFEGLKLDSVTYIRKEVHDEIYARCNPECLDQLITKDGAMTGTCCLNTLDEPFSLLSSVALVKLKREIMLPHFLNYFLRSPTGQDLMLGDISGAAITRTNLRKLKEIKVPLPPMKEQQCIVAHLDGLSERTRTLEVSTKEKLNDINSLKASLLDAAFKGAL